MGLRSVFIATALGCGLFCALGSTTARAQHVVTDMEAGKLTLDALTAAPRPVYRPIMALRRVRRVSYATRSSHFHLAAYRPAYRRRMGHAIRH